MLPIPDRDRLALFLDIDGTLVELAARPSEVRVPPGLADLLKDLDRVLDGAVALVSGRAIDDFDRLLRPLRLRAAGVHGAETRTQPDGPIERSEDSELPPALLADLHEMLTAFPGVVVENKRHAYAVHYRAVPDVADDLGRAVRACVERRPGLVVMPGHAIFEIKHPTHTKGTAVADFMQQPPFSGRVPVFIGDDVTDVAGFEAVRGFGGMTYSVGREMTGVDDWFGNPAEVRQWLEAIAGMAPAEP